LNDFYLFRDLVVLIDLGYVTHANHANSRVVYLSVQSRQSGSLVVQGPPNGNVYPPGPGWLHVVVDGVPSEGIKTMIGDGRGPPVDESAILKSVLSNLYFVFYIDLHNSVLEHTSVDQA
jgi:hypothetical protein